MKRKIDSSFAPDRKLNKIMVMIDGESYFKNLAMMLQKAKRQIFISGWWLCSKYYLLRPASLSSEVDCEKS